MLIVVNSNFLKRYNNCFAFNHSTIILKNYPFELLFVLFFFFRIVSLPEQLVFVFVVFVCSFVSLKNTLPKKGTLKYFYFQILENICVVNLQSVFPCLKFSQSPQIF